jgi:hypothetical protein
MDFNTLLNEFKTKKPRIEPRFFALKAGADLLSRDFVPVPSALAGLTTLFGMGRGDPRRSKHHYLLYLQYFNILTFIDISRVAMM